MSWDLFIGAHGDLIDFLTAAATNSLRALCQFESEHTNPAIICLWAGIGDHGDLIDFLAAAATNSLRALSQFESEHTNPAHICIGAGIPSLVTMVT